MQSLLFIWAQENSITNKKGFILIEGLLVLLILSLMLLQLLQVVYFEMVVNDYQDNSREKVDAQRKHFD